MEVAVGVQQGWQTGAAAEEQMVSATPGVEEVHVEGELPVAQSWLM
jgi:hypothetical protein